MGLSAIRLNTMDYLTRKSAARLGSIGRWLTSGRYPWLEALGVRVTAGKVSIRELAEVTQDIGIAVHLPSTQDMPAAEADRSLAVIGPSPAELKAKTVAYLEGLARFGWARLQDLSEPERSRFCRWLDENRCTAPVIDGVPEPEQDAFYLTDLAAFRSGNPAPD